MRSEGRAEGLRAFAERERTLRATNEPEKGARRAAVRAAEVAKRQPTRELERETGNVARWKAAKAARGRGRKVAERDDVARAAREARAKLRRCGGRCGSRAAAGGRDVLRSGARTPLWPSGVPGRVGDIKALSWKQPGAACRVAPVDMPVAGDGWQQAPDGLEYTRVPARRWAKRTPTDTTVVWLARGETRERGAGRERATHGGESAVRVARQRVAFARKRCRCRQE